MSSKASATATRPAAIRHREAAQRLANEAMPKAKSNESPSTAITANREGERAMPMSGTYRRIAHGPMT